jgi:peptidoglycan hydrolase-like protein with peptidoglycan-binding domain
MHPGPVNGVMSRETQAAIRAFQKDQKITGTGQLDSQTREKLGITP